MSYRDLTIDQKRTNSKIFFNASLGYGADGKVDNKLTKSRLSGTKYSHYGSRKEGISSMMDSEITNRRRELERENFGGGSTTIQVQPDKDGNFVPMNIGGRFHFPDEEGFIRIIDGASLDRLQKLEQEKREYLKQVIDRLSLSNDICSMAFGTDCEKLFGRGQNGDGVIKDPELIKVDATPEAIENYAEDSLVWAQAIQKFKLIVKAYMPAIQDMTDSKQAHEVAKPGEVI